MKPDHPRIDLWGDSLTEGRPGVAFADRLARRFGNVRWVNHGLGGDTVQSLKRRLEASSAGPDSDPAFLSVLWIGVNDVFADAMPGYALWKAALRQPPTRSEAVFRRIYRTVLDESDRRAERVLVLPPLFVGENPDTPLNRRVRRLGDIIRTVSDDRPSCRFLDIREDLPLRTSNPPRFLTVNPWSRLAEAFGRVSDDDYDRAADRRGLDWTFDGVHLNSRGADRVADRLAAAIQEELT